MLAHVLVSQLGREARSDMYPLHALLLFVDGTYAVKNSSSAEPMVQKERDVCTMQAVERSLGAELDEQRKRVSAVHARLAGQASTCLAGITPSKPGMSLFVQYCILPRVTHSAEVRIGRPDALL